MQSSLSRVQRLIPTILVETSPQLTPPRHRLLQRWFGALCVIGGACAIAVATLIPIPHQATASAETTFFCFPCGEIGGVDIVVNILLFLPFAFGLGLLGVRWSVGVLIAAAASCTVELLQAFVIPGRDPGFSDIVSNSLGGALGVFLGRFFWQLIQPTDELARRLTWSVASLVIVIMALSAYFLSPSWPATPWWGQWQPRHLHTADFLGTVIDARIGSVPVPADSLRQGDSVRTALRAGVPLETTVISGRPTATTAPILRLAFNDNEIAMISQSGLDVVFRVRLRTASALLKTPSVRLPRVLPPTAGDTVRIAASYLHNRYEISSSTAGRNAQAQGTMHPTFGWATLLPLDYALGAEARWFAALWVAAMFLPMGYWVVFAGRASGIGFGSVGPIPVAAVASLGLVPLVFGFEVAGGAQWLGAGVGASVGALAALAVRYTLRHGHPDDLRGDATPGKSSAGAVAPVSMALGRVAERTAPEHERR